MSDTRMKKQFEHNGLKCEAILTMMGHYCGYVSVPKEHPWFGVSYSDKVIVPEAVMSRPIDVDKVGAINLFCTTLTDEDKEANRLDLVLAVDVHGGLTYAGADGDLWQFGFDCAHAGDARFPGDPNGVWRDEAYVVGECKSLADQLVAVTVTT